MKKKKALSIKEKPDEWVSLAQSILDQQNFNYQNYDEERSSIVVNSRIYEKMKLLTAEVGPQNKA